MNFLIFVDELLIIFSYFFFWYINFTSNTGFFSVLKIHSYIKIINKKNEKKNCNTIECKLCEQGFYTYAKPYHFITLCDELRRLALSIQPLFIQCQWYVCVNFYMMDYLPIFMCERVESHWIICRHPLYEDAHCIIHKLKLI